MKKGKAKPIIVVAAVVTVAVITYLVLNLVFSPYWDSVFAPTGYLSLASMREATNDSEIFTKKQASEDIDYLMKRLKRVHPSCIDGVPENVLNAAESAKASFGDEVSPYDIWRACASVLHELNDAHSMAAPSFSMNYLTDYADMLDSGCELAAINGISVEDIFDDNSEYISYELEPWGVNVIQGLAGTREGLTYLGVYSDPIEYTYRFSDGSTSKKTYTKDDFYNHKAVENLTDTADVPYSANIIEENNAAVLTLEECIYDMEFKEFLYNFFTEINEKEIGNIVIDLRDNSGGTSQVLDELLVYLDHDSFKTPAGQWRLGPYMMKWESEDAHITHMDDQTLFGGNVYVLTSSGTFSSATLIAEILQDNGFAEIVGEECGNMPEGYGEVVAFQTPNAAVTFQISSKHFERIDQSKRELPLIPDIKTQADMALLEVMDEISK